MNESDVRARSSNQRSHRSPRHAVARALTHQASPASIRAQPKFDNGILIPERWPAGRPGTLLLKPVGWAVAFAGGWALRSGPALDGGVIPVRAFLGREGCYLVAVNLGEVFGHHQ